MQNPSRAFMGIIWLGHINYIKCKGHIFGVIEERIPCRNFVQNPHPVGQDVYEVIILE
jgi:hypothetical protein